MQVLTNQYVVLDAIKVLFFSLTAIHFFLSIIFFIIRYKDRMRYLRQHKLTKLRGVFSEAFHFFVIFTICMIVGSFLLIQSTIRFLKLVRSLKSIKKDLNKMENLKYKKPATKQRVYFGRFGRGENKQIENKHPSLTLTKTLLCGCTTFLKSVADNENRYAQNCQSDYGVHNASFSLTCHFYVFY